MNKNQEGRDIKVCRGSTQWALEQLEKLVELIEQRVGDFGINPKGMAKGRREMTIAQPKLLVGGKLQEYQIEALKWMVQLASKQLNGILADDMGMGKTIQTISFFAYMQQQHGISGKHLIICPKNVLSNWQREIKKWLPTVRVVVLHATQAQRQQCIEKYIRNRKFDIVVTTYQGLVSAYDALKRIRYESFIIDEAHKIKNQNSILATYARSYKSKFKLLLTGTPLSNNLHQLWSLLFFILPDIFGDDQLFNEIQKAVNAVSQDQKQVFNAKIQIAKKFHQIIYPFILRRTKAQINLGLPPKTQKTIFAPMTKLQLTMYKNMLKYRSPYGQNGTTFASMHMQLRKICNHPYLFPDIQAQDLPLHGDHLYTNSGKMLVLDKLIQKLLKEKHKILIFSQFTTQLDIIQDYCSYKNIQISRIDGSKSMQQRDSDIAKFNNGQTQIFLLSTRAGGLGINLVAADRVIIYDIDWNPQNDNQAMDRAYRIGQTRPVHIFKLVTQFSVEERMLEVQKYKLIWDELVIQKGNLMGKKKADDIVGKMNFQEIALKGKGQIFRLKDCVDDRTIDELIQLGDQKDKKKNQQIKMKLLQQLKSDNQTINPFEEKQQDQGVTNEQKLYVSAILNPKKREKQLKNKLDNIWVPPVRVPHCHLYQKRAELQQAIRKREKMKAAKDIGLNKYSQQEQQQLDHRIQQYQKGAFKNWTTYEYNKFCQANLSLKCDQYQKIAQIIGGGKTAKQVKQYSKAFFERAQNDTVLVLMDAKIKKYQQKSKAEDKQRKLVAWMNDNGFKCKQPNMTLKTFEDGTRQVKQETLRYQIYSQCIKICENCKIGSFQQLKDKIVKIPNIYNNKEYVSDKGKQAKQMIKRFWKNMMGQVQKQFQKSQIQALKEQQDKLKEKKQNKKANRENKKTQKQKTQNKNMKQGQTQKIDSNQTLKTVKQGQKIDPKKEKKEKKQKVKKEKVIDEEQVVEVRIPRQV